MASVIHYPEFLGSLIKFKTVSIEAALTQALFQHIYCSGHAVIESNVFSLYTDSLNISLH
jgi:hypothetical protein